MDVSSATRNSVGSALVTVANRVTAQRHRNPKFNDGVFQMAGSGCLGSGGRLLRLALAEGAMAFVDGGLRA